MEWILGVIIAVLLITLVIALEHALVYWTTMMAVLAYLTDKNYTHPSKAEIDAYRKQIISDWVKTLKH